MEATSPELRPVEKTEPLERKIERWARYLGELTEEMYFYEILERWLRDECRDVEIWLDENPWIGTWRVVGADHIRHGRAHYINELKCDNNMYELDIEYEIFEFIEQETGDITTVIVKVDNVNVRKIEERAGE